MGYIASHEDLIRVIGANREAGAAHYMAHGRLAGRETTFDGSNYLAANADLRAAFGNDGAAAAQHYVTNGFFEGRSPGAATATPGTPAPSIPAVSEGTRDLPSNTSTSGFAPIRGTVTGRITLFDRDWYKTTLNQGETVTFSLSGRATGGGTLGDPVVRLYGDDGRYLAFNDDGGPGLDSLLRYTPGRSGDYFVAADGYGYSTGSYTLTVLSGRTSNLNASSAGAASTEDPSIDRMISVPDTEIDISKAEHSQVSAFGPEPEDYAAQHALGRDWDLF